MSHTPTKTRRRSSSPPPMTEVEKETTETKTPTPHIGTEPADHPTTPTAPHPVTEPVADDPTRSTADAAADDAEVTTPVRKPPPAPGPAPRTKMANVVAKKNEGGTQPEKRIQAIFGFAVPGGPTRPKGPQALDQALGIIDDAVAAATARDTSLAVLFRTLTDMNALPSLPLEDRITLIRMLLSGLAGHKLLTDVLDAQPAFFTTVLNGLVDGNLTPLTPEDCYPLAGQLISHTFGHPNLIPLCTAQPALVCTMLRHAYKLTGNPLAVKVLRLPEDFVQQLLQLGGKTDPTTLAPVKLNLACTFLTTNWTITDITEIGPDLLNWTCSTITPKEWNRDKDPLGPLCLNMLWVCGQHDTISKLLKAGVDGTRSTSAWGVTGREGVWTGYVQPLTHVLGKYIEGISLLGTTQEGTIKDLARVRGAQQIVAVLGGLTGKPDLVLDFSVVVKSPLVAAFHAFTDPAKVGTIWGFEDVRLPYVQAARATKVGQRPLRMLDMWEAVSVIFEPKEYAALIADPATVAKRSALTGAEKVKKGVAAGSAQYDGVILEQFLPNFVDTCTSFLTYFATEVPFVKTLELAGSTGKNASKLMPSLVCKIGLWWSLRHGREVFYCLDGLNMNDVVGYKANKTAKINEYLTALSVSPTTTLLPFQDVITFAELREVLKNWTKLRPVVRLVMRGELMSADKADQWAATWTTKMDTVDADPNNAPRMWTDSQGAVRDEVRVLVDDEGFWNHILPAVERSCALEFKSVKLAATGGPDVLVKTLHDCTALMAAGILPEPFVTVYEQALAADGSRRILLASMLRYMLKFTSAALRAPLLTALNRHLPPPPLLLGPAPTTT